MNIKVLFSVLGCIFLNTLCLRLFFSLLAVCNSSLKMTVSKFHVDRGGFKSAFTILLLF